MIAKHPVKVLDIYEYLPSYGENAVVCTYQNPDLIVEILYDSHDSEDELKKTIWFSKTCFYMFTSSPGIELMNINYEPIQAQDLGSLIEYKESSPADHWSLHFGLNSKKIRHFQLFFLSENKRLEVFATDINLT